MDPLLRWLLPILSILTGVLFLISLFALVKAVSIFAMSVKSHSKALQVKAIRLAILPIVYIATMLIYFKTRPAGKKHLQEVPGTYIYKTGPAADGEDSVKVAAFLFILKGDQTFQYVKDGDITTTGKWSLKGSGNELEFYDHEGHLVWKCNWSKSREKTMIWYKEEGEPVEFIKGK